MFKQQMCTKGHAIYKKWNFSLMVCWDCIYYYADCLEVGKKDGCVAGRGQSGQQNFNTLLYSCMSSYSFYRMKKTFKLIQ